MISISINKICSLYKNIFIFYLFISYPIVYHADKYLSGISANGILFTIIALSCIIQIVQHKNIHILPVELFSFFFLIWYVGCRLYHEEQWPIWWFLHICGGILIYIYFRSSTPGKMLFLLLFLSGLIQSGWCLLQINDLLPSCSDFQKGTGFFFNTALSGIYQVISLFGGLYLWQITPSHLLKVLILSGIGILIFLIILLDSRASWLALAIGCCWLLIKSSQLNNRIRSIFLLKKKWQHKLLGWMGLLFVVLLFLSICFLLYKYRPSSVQGRFLIWQASLDSFTQHLWTGNGRFQSWYMLAQADWLSSNSKAAFLSAGNTYYAFNELLRIVTESGLIGLLMISVVVIIFFKQARDKNKEVLYSKSILITLAVFGCFSYPFSVEWLSFIAIIFYANVFSESSTKVSWRIPVFLKYLYLPGIICFMVICFQHYRELHYADQLLAKPLYKKNSYNDQQLQESYKSLTDHAGFVRYYGQKLYDEKWYEEAIPVLEKSFIYWPNSHTACELGHCYYHNRQYEKAEQYYQLAIRMVPGHFLSRYYLFCLYQETGQTEKAKEQAHKILKLPIKIVNTTVLNIRKQSKNYLDNLINP